MDPNATLETLREWVCIIQEHPESVDMEDAAADMSELFAALDGWLVRGGFRPEDWQ